MTKSKKRIDQKHLGVANSNIRNLRKELSDMVRFALKSEMEANKGGLLEYGANTYVFLDNDGNPLVNESNIEELKDKAALLQEEIKDYDKIQDFHSHLFYETKIR